MAVSRAPPSVLWDADTILNSVLWLRYQNYQGRDIYIRPKGEHDLSMVDDLTRDSVLRMKKEGFSPVAVVETSPGKYQAWLRHPERLGKEMSTAAARALAQRFGGDRGAADWRHFGRLSGFTNRKAKHLDITTGLYPFVRLVETDDGVYSEAERFLTVVKRDLERQRGERERWRQSFTAALPPRREDLKSIDAFRADGRYGGDGTRIDLAYAVYAFSRGLAMADIETAIRSRDLSHKGNERRQKEYVERTVQKALVAIDRGR